MKKDYLVAVAIGFIVGAIFAVFVVFLPSIIRSGSNKITALTRKNQITPTSVMPTVNPLSMTISEPNDSQIVNTNKTKVKGKTKSNSVILATTELDGAAVEASEDGTFSFELALTEGHNELMITSYSDENTSEIKILNVFYTPEKI